jgi:haloacetate dehalogenase
MFEGFDERRIQVSDDVEIYAKFGGSGPGLLLLHGFPQTHVCWHKIAPALAKTFTVVVPDLRGYGASSKPKACQGHANYSKREMASDQVQIMKQLGFDRFRVIGHDRGGRVAHRMALDHGAAVERLAVIDIAPTAAMYDGTDRAFAEAYYHWFFLIQPYDFPERLIGADPEYFLRHTLNSWCRIEGAITPEAFEAYLWAFRNPQAIHAACEDYRASATIDLEHDAVDRQSGKKIEAPLSVYWGRAGTVGRQFEVVDTWQQIANASVTGKALAGGHFIPEENPIGLLEALGDFLA